MYPLEYLILGRHPERQDLEVSIDDKLATITDGAWLRLFLWKLHNAVSASIARTEPWYHRDDKAFYTSRYWPSLDSELARTPALDQPCIPTERLARLYGLLKPMAQLAGRRRDLQEALQAGDWSKMASICDQVRPAVADLEAALAAGTFLRHTYRFDPDLVDEAPHFTLEEEEFGRSDVFVET